MSKYDKIDAQIVDLLMEDGRMPASEIARKVGGISERVARYRIDRMVKDGIIAISAIPNPKAFGYNVVADVFIEVDAGQIYEVANRLLEYERVSYVACSIGERDISAQVLAHSNAEVYQFATEVIGRLTGVRKTTTSIVPLVLKDVYQWRIPPAEAREDQDRSESKGKPLGELAAVQNDVERNPDEATLREEPGSSEASSGSDAIGGQLEFPLLG